MKISLKDQPYCLKFTIGWNQDNTRMLCKFHSIDEHSINHSKWNNLDPTDNKIVVPFSSMSGYPANYRQAVLDATTRMNQDSGCLKAIFVPEEGLATTSFTNDIFIA